MPSLTFWQRLVLPALLFFFLFSNTFLTEAAAQRARGGPDLAVQQIPPPGGCGLGRICTIDVRIRNRGARPFVGVLRLNHEAKPKRIAMQDRQPQGWTCRGRGSNGQCTQTTGILPPQRVTIVPVDFFVPANIGRRRIQVCTAIDWRAPGALNSRNRIMQALLARRGYRMDPPDGIVGPQTRAAIAQFQLANRIRVTGLPDRRTVRALVGPWGVGDAVARNDRACINVRLSRRGPVPPEPEYEQPAPPVTTPAPVEEPDQLEVPPPPGQGPLACGPNEVPSQSGCRCKPSYRVNLNGECIRQQEATTPPPAKPETPCTGGKFRSARGECVCPADKKDVNGVCQRPGKPREPVSTPEPAPPAPASPEPVTVPEPEPEPKSCPGNQILGTDGKCGCYLDMKTKDGKCLVKVRKDCLPGQIINIRGKCECPKGETVRDGKCARP